MRGGQRPEARRVSWWIVPAITLGALGWTLALFTAW